DLVRWRNPLRKHMKSARIMFHESDTEQNSMSECRQDDHGNQEKSSSRPHFSREARTGEGGNEVPRKCGSGGGRGILRRGEPFGRVGWALRCARLLRSEASAQLKAAVRRKGASWPAGGAGQRGPGGRRGRNSPPGPRASAGASG